MVRRPAISTLFPTRRSSDLQAPHYVAGVRGFLGVRDRQRSLCMELVPMGWPARRPSEAGLGSRFRLVVDDSRSLCRGRPANGNFAEGRASRLDWPRKLTAASGERENECPTTSNA